MESGNGVVGCYDAKTGKPLWRRTMSEFGGKVPGWGYAESVLILGNLAIVTPGGANCIVALDKNTGKPVWHSTGFSAGAQYGGCLPFTYENVPLLAAGTGGGIFCVDARNGALVWSNDFSAKNTANCPTPAYADGYVFWANGYGKGGICMKLGASGGRVTAQVAYKTSDMVCHHGGYIIDNGYVYGNNEGGWSCLDLKTGQRKWHDKGVGKGSALWADGMLYLFGEKGGEAALATCSPQGMQIKGRVTVQGSGTSWAHPVVIGGRLYLRYDTNLYCFDVKAKP
jgi:outer membrane protein assembly factor BamB